MNKLIFEEFSIDFKNQCFSLTKGNIRSIRFSDVKKLEIYYGSPLKNRGLLLLFSAGLILFSFLMANNLINVLSTSFRIIDLENAEIRRIGVNIILILIPFSSGLFTIFINLKKYFILNINDTKLIASRNRGPEVLMLEEQLRSIFNEKLKIR